MSDDAFKLLLTWGPGGVVVLLMLLGMIIPKWSYAALQSDRDAWRKAAEDERAAHERTREALMLASQQSAASTEAAKITGQLLKELKHPAARGPE